MIEGTTFIAKTKNFPTYRYVYLSIIKKGKDIIEHRLLNLDLNEEIEVANNWFDNRQIIFTN